MNKYFECKVKYRKTDELGKNKTVTESYLVDGISFTDAETRINEELAKYISEEFKVTNIKPSNYAEIHPCENSDRWFKSKVSLMAYDEESGKERKQNLYLLVAGLDVEDAYTNTISAMKNTMDDYSIPSVSETAIIEVFEYISAE